MKTQKWYYIVVAIPIIALPILFIVYDMSIGSILTITALSSILALASIITFKQREKLNASTQKRRKALLTIMGLFISFLVIMTIVWSNLWENIFSNFGTLLQFIVLIGIFIYAFFRKGKI